MEKLEPISFLIIFTQYLTFSLRKEGEGKNEKINEEQPER